MHGSEPAHDRIRKGRGHKERFSPHLNDIATEEIPHSDSKTAHLTVSFHICGGCCTQDERPLLPSGERGFTHKEALVNFRKEQRALGNPGRLPCPL
jgi:hypothetical protein